MLTPRTVQISPLRMVPAVANSRLTQDCAVGEGDVLGRSEGREPQDDGTKSSHRVIVTTETLA
jgi:hypothetical protein